MKAQHTPAPWKLQDYDHAFVVWSDEGVICDVFHNREDDEADGIFSEEEANANAQLIAAAPELLAALRRAENALTFFIEDKGESDLDALEETRAAIAKATT